MLRICSAFLAVDLINLVPLKNVSAEDRVTKMNGTSSKANEMQELSQAASHFSSFAGDPLVRSENPDRFGRCPINGITVCGSGSV